MNTTKVGWGTRIAFLYGGFVVLMVSLVTLSMKQDFSLVSDDYYKEELAYQHTIDASKNTASLSAPVTIDVQQQNIVLHFPQEFAGMDLAGTIHFYSPVATRFDRKFPIDEAGNTMYIKREGIADGTYTMKMNWTASGKTYYQEIKLNLK